MKKLKPILILLTAVFVVLACSRKKDSWTSRTYHQGVSKYNTYFNGEQAYIKGVATVEAGQIDDYYKVLSVFKWGDDKLRQSVVPDMDRAVEKGSKVIKTHSMEFKGKQKNQYVVKSFMLIGQARFYKGDYFPALETFNYIINNFDKSKVAQELVLEANLWAAKCQVQIGNNVSASNYLDVVYRNKKLDKNLGDDVSATMAQMNINKKKYEEAYNNLREAVLKSKNKTDKTRWIYIMGQLQEILGNKYEASTHFKKVVSLKPVDYDMYFTAQLKRALNFDVYMESSSVIYNELEKMLADDKNFDLRDQIYYVMALIALSEEDFATAEGYLKESVKTSTVNKKQKGESYTKLAEIAFQFKTYVAAQSFYDSAYVSLPANHEKYEEVEIRKEKLTELVAHINVITEQDSLLKLSNMSLEKQQKLIKQYIKDLKESEERMLREAELKALNNQLANEASNQLGGPSVGTTGGGWYFYNENARGSGLSSFKKQWGNRELEDDWRQKTRSADQIANENQNQQESDTAKVNSANLINAPTDQYDPEFYLAQIPKTNEEKDTANSKILRAYLALGRIYFQDLNDWSESVSAYQKSLSRYPKNKYEPRTRYFLFLIYSKQKLNVEAEEQKKILVSQYPETEYAQLLIHPDRFNKKGGNYEEASKAYEVCFDFYKDKQYKKCLSCLAKAEKNLTENPLAAKIILLKAYCIGKTKKQLDFEEALNLVITNYSGTPEANIAKATLDQIGGIIAQQELLKESPYKESREEKHRFIVIVHTKGLNLNNVRNDVSDYNKVYHKFEKLVVQNIFLDGQTQMMMVTGLESADKAEKYLKGILLDQKIMGYLPPETTKKMVISESNFKTFYSRKDEKEYLDFFYATYNYN